MSGIRDDLLLLLKRRMSDNGWSQVALAAAVGITPKHINQILSGRVEGTLTMWDRLIEAADEQAPERPRKQGKAWQAGYEQGFADAQALTTPPAPDAVAGGA